MEKNKIDFEKQILDLIEEENKKLIKGQFFCNTISDFVKLIYKYNRGDLIDKSIKTIKTLNGKNKIRIIAELSRELACYDKKRAEQIINLVSISSLKKLKKYKQKDFLEHKALVYTLTGKLKQAQEFLNQATLIKSEEDKEDQEFEDKSIIEDYAIRLAKIGANLKNKKLVDIAYKTLINSKFGYDEPFMLSICKIYLEMKDIKIAEKIIENSIKNAKKQEDSQKEWIVQTLFSIFEKNEVLYKKYIDKAISVMESIKKKEYKLQAIMCYLQLYYKKNKQDDMFKKIYEYGR
ncbi:MAG: hypothetical protein B6U87_01865 [Candidatus Aenigmarchaeota archaeon ex4484_52]|nr:MAG: hypothetical protein B6U87_01865 [Candidatus Aenigmarchaeota archaeon ex4484_52]